MDNMRRATIISLLLLWVWIAFTLSADYYLVNNSRAIKESDLKLLPAERRSAILHWVREPEKIETVQQEKPEPFDWEKFGAKPVETPKPKRNGAVIPPPPPGFVLEPKKGKADKETKINFRPARTNLNVWRRELRINYVLLVWFLLPPVLISPMLWQFWLYGKRTE